MKGPSGALTIPEVCPLPAALPLPSTIASAEECSTSSRKGTDDVTCLNGTAAAAQRPRSLRFLQLKTGDSSAVILPISAPSTSKDAVESLGEFLLLFKSHSI